MTIRIVLFSFGLLFGHQALASMKADGLFGIYIGTKLSEYKVCPAYAVGERYKDRVADLCFETERSSPDWVTFRIPNMTPGYLSGLLVMVSDDSNVLLVLASTNGEYGQEEAYQDLIRKLGKPTSVHIDKLQNSFGARLDGINAVWTRKGCRYELTGIGDERDEGRISLSSNAANGLIAKRERERKAQQIGP